jgi:5-methylcytosine-specific restriction protein A
MFILGNEYRRSDLHSKYGGQKQGGISTPSKHNFIMLFTGTQGHQYGYEDEWTDEGLFIFTGEGQRGDMPFIRGNKAIRDHTINHKDLHLFEYVRKGYVRYIGQMVYMGYGELRRQDIDGNERSAIVFELMPIDVFDATMLSGDKELEGKLWQEPIESLREHAIASSSIAKSPVERIALARYRSNAIKVYVLRRAGGVCEACGSDAPFVTASGKHYLEPHHILRLSDTGPDHPKFVVGLCPNCHRRAHYARNKAAFNKKLADIVNGKEKQLKQKQ